MAAVAGGGTRRADGLIDPDGIPGVDMAPELIRSAAWTLASASAGVSQHGATAVTKWQTMSTVYEAPESEALLAVMGPVGQETTALADGFTKVGKALTDFADTVAPIVAKLVELKAEAVAFVAQAEQGYDLPAIGPQPTTQLTDYGSVQSSPGGMYSAPAHHVEWTEYAPYSQRNDKLIMAVATLATALDEAQADCVNKIAAAHPPANSCPETVHGTDFTTAAKEGKPLPFGQTAAGRPNCVTSFGGGVGDAAKGMVEGLGSLVSYNPETGQWGDWDHAGKAALGVVEGLGSLIAPTPLFQVLADDSSGVTPGWMRDFSKSTLDKQQQMVDGFVGSKEQWQTDPARAAGSLFVNVGSLFIPGAGEVAAGAKVVSVGARVASVGGRVAEAADAASIAGRVVGAGARASVVAGSGLVRVGDLMTQVAARADALGHAATAPVMNALRDVVDRVPHVEVAVRHVVTPDGFRIPTLHVEVGDSARTRAMSSSAHAGERGVLEHGAAGAHVSGESASAGASAVGRGAVVDAMRGVEHHATDAGGRHAASTDVVERPGGVHGGEDARGVHESGDGAGHEPGAGQSAEHRDGHVDGAHGGDEHGPGVPEAAGAEQSRLHASSEGDYWRPLSHQEIQDLPVVRDGSHIRADGTLRPNIWYQTGEHEYLYRTNEHGHIDRVIAENLQLKMHTGRLRHIRRTLGKLFGDHAGHLVADWFGGSPRLDNVVSQLERINRREFGSLERRWAQVLKQDPPGHVSLDIRVDSYAATGRPGRFVVVSVVDGARAIRVFKQ
ncbi:DNA/RNA non-specific endonuclease [Clavibacter tessellarius]|uniref:DNA/RNA non-specific endonuclease n=2 Tax=Clavibacter TaxID=1573 RepID=UPI000A5E27CC|nr:DNA/RNA non-specific endonuclease [Clavibacter michiganensis]